MTRKQAIEKLQKVENGLRTAQSVIGGYADDLKAVREKLEGKDGSSDA